MTLSVLVNSIPGDPFRLKSGIRQGDPVSPYIFIICVEYLGRYINYISNIENFGICNRVAKNGPTIHYLMFLALL